MSGSRSAFEKAMQKGQDYAAANEWPKALAEYEKGVKEFPNDLGAKGNLALALFQVGRWHDAIDQYHELNELMPNNITILDHLSAAYINVGALSEAEKIYWDLAQLYVDSQRLSLAIETLERLIQFAPNRMEAHEHLASLYEQKNDGERAAKCYLSLAKLHASAHRWVEATKYCERALILDGLNTGAIKMLEEMKVQREAIEIGIRGPAALNASDHQAQKEQLQQIQRSAEELQSLGRYAEALEKYQEMLDAGAEEPHIRYSVGLLLQQTGQIERAIGQFALITGDKEYAVSALYGLGECYESLRQLDSAGSYYEKAISQIDTRTLRRTEMDELVQMHEKAAGCYASMGDSGKAAAIYESLAVLLHSKGWGGERTEQIRRKAQSLTESSIRAKLRQLDEPAPRTSAGKPPMVPKKETGPLQLGILGKKVTGPLRPITYFLPPIEAAEVPVVEPADPASAVAVADQPQESLRQEEEESPPLAAPSSTGLIESAGARILAVQTADARLAEDTAASSGNATAAGIPAKGGETEDQRSRMAADQQAILAIADRLEANAEAAPVARSGDCYRDAGLYNAALDCYLDAIGHAPDLIPLHFRLADVYKSQGRLQEAIEKYRTIVELCELRGEPASLILACQELLLLQPRDTTLREKLVRSLLPQHAYALATVEAGILVEALLASLEYEMAAEKAKAMETFLPDWGWARLYYGRLLMKLAMFQEAKPYLEHCLRFAEILAPALASLTINLILTDDRSGSWEQNFTELLGEVAGARTDLESILSQFEEAVSLSRRPELSYCLGRLLATIGRDDDAVMRLEAALDRPSDIPGFELAVRTTLVQSLMNRRRTSEALPQLLACISLTSGFSDGAEPLVFRANGGLPNKAELYKSLAECYTQQADSGKAIEALQSAKALAPGDEEVLNRLSSVLLDSGDHHGAVRQLQEVAELQEANGRLPDLRITLGRIVVMDQNNIAFREKLVDVLRRMHNFEAAAGELEQLAKVQARQGIFDAAIRSSWEGARFLWQLGRREDVFQCLEQSLQFIPEPHNAPLRHELINLYLGTKQRDKALEHLRAGVKTAMAANRATRAVGYIQRILSLSPNDIFAYHQLALILVRHGEYRQAAKFYSRLIKLQPGNPKLVELRDHVLRKALEQEGSARNAG